MPSPPDRFWTARISDIIPLRFLRPGWLNRDRSAQIWVGSHKMSTVGSGSSNHRWGTDSSYVVLIRTLRPRSDGPRGRYPFGQGIL
jgi:hypothetical protein